MTSLLGTQSGTIKQQLLDEARRIYGFDKSDEERAEWIRSKYRVTEVTPEVLTWEDEGGTIVVEVEEDLIESYTSPEV